MATVHHPSGDMAPRRNLRTLWIVLALIAAVAIVYSVASAVSQNGPSDGAVLPADQPVTGGVTANGGIIDQRPAQETTTTPATRDETLLPGKAVTDGAGSGTVTDPTTGQTDNGVATGARPTDG